MKHDRKDNELTMSRQSRRRFLQVSAASIALAGGCDQIPTRPPKEDIVAYVNEPEHLAQGLPTYYATTLTVAGYGFGAVVETHEGRPTKIEGNPKHPASLGASDAFLQASLLSLYDPHRSQQVLKAGKSSTWDEAFQALDDTLAEQLERGGEGVRVLTGDVASPTMLAALAEMRKRYPKASWHVFEPIGDANAARGASTAFGADVASVHHLDKAKVILSLDADFLAQGPGRLAYARQFTDGRRLVEQHDPTHATMNRLYVAEPSPTITGVAADHRFAIPASAVETLTRRIASKLGVEVDPNTDAPLAIDDAVVDAIVEDLQANAGECVVMVGKSQPSSVHALAHLINERLGAIGKTIDLIEPPANLHEHGSLESLVSALQAGDVELLVVIDANPVYSAAANNEFAAALDQASLTFHMGLYVDETAAACDWHLPMSHELESWGDARAYEGTTSLTQPMIDPLYGTRSPLELVDRIATAAERKGHDILRAHWHAQWEAQHGQSQTPKWDFEETFWNVALHDGVIADSKSPPKAVSISPNVLADMPPAATDSADPVELVFRPDPTLHDGRYAENGWLQELPKPVTKVTWDNPVLISPATAEKLGVEPQRVNQAGPARAELVKLKIDGRELETAVWVTPGVADDCVIVSLGGGRTVPGVGKPVGFNAYAIRPDDKTWFVAEYEVERLGRRYPIACTQPHQTMAHRPIVKSATLDEFHASPTFAKLDHTPEPGKVEHKDHAHADVHHEQHGEHVGEEHRLSLYPEHPYNGYKWGMVIDQTACIGCGACIVACQAENNIPVVGKDQVAAGREMQWLRVDCYDHGAEDEAAYRFQPVPCMHCETAPCELVCPVEATAHSKEGLNDMVYNRCVGTRYCSNNCPYKVRRFNWFQYTVSDEESLRMMYNPNVTIRTRGVMEKCTYCIQRISRARIEAGRRGERVADGAIQTACQAACPARAISFGDLNDETSVVRHRADSVLNYPLFGVLNTFPRTTYLAAVSNPNPRISKQS